MFRSIQSTRTLFVWRTFEMNIIRPFYVSCLNFSLNEVNFEWIFNITNIWCKKEVARFCSVLKLPHWIYLETMNISLLCTHFEWRLSNNRNLIQMNRNFKYLDKIALIWLFQMLQSEIKAGLWLILANFIVDIETERNEIQLTQYSICMQGDCFG